MWLRVKIPGFEYEYPLFFPLNFGVALEDSMLILSLPFSYAVLAIEIVTASYID